MNLKFVEAFIWVCRLNSVTRAAEKLCLTQSAVSNRIAALESELGVELIDRRNPRFRLSHAGTRFMSYAEKLLALQRDLRNELGTPERQPFSLRIGAIESVLHSWLLPLVDTLKRKLSPVNFELTVETSVNLVELIRRGSLDLVFSALPAQEEGLVNETLTPFEMVFAGNAAMAETPRLSLERLLACDIMTFQRGSHPHMSLVNALHAIGIGNKYVHAISSISALAILAGGGFGIATLPRPVVEKLAATQQLAIVETPLQLPPLPLHAIYWRYPTDSVLTRAIGQALSFIESYERTAGAR